MKLLKPRPGRDAAEEIAARAAHVPVQPVPPELTARSGRSPLFDGLAEQEVSRVLARFDTTHFPAGHTVLREDLKGNDFFIIVAGTAAVLVGGRRLGQLGPGDFFGDLGVLSDGRRLASVRAERPLHCLVLSNGLLEQLLLDHPRLGVNMLRGLVTRFRSVGGWQAVPAAQSA